MPQLHSHCVARALLLLLLYLPVLMLPTSAEMKLSAIPLVRNDMQDEFTGCRGPGAWGAQSTPVSMLQCNFPGTVEYGDIMHSNAENMKQIQTDVNHAESLQGTKSRTASIEIVAAYYTHREET